VTDRRTDRHPHRFMIWPHVVGHIIRGMKSVRDIDEKMEQPSTCCALIRSHSEGSRICVCCRQRVVGYKRVKTEGNVKYLKCCKIGCDGSAKIVDDVMYAGVRRPNTISAVLLTIIYYYSARHGCSNFSLSTVAIGLLWS